MLSTLGYAGVVGVIVAFFSSKVRRLFLQGLEAFLGLFIKTVSVDNEIGVYLIGHMRLSGYKLHSFGSSNYTEQSVWVKPLRRQIHVLFRNFAYNSTLVYGNRSWPLLVSGWGERRNSTDIVTFPYTIRFLRFTVNVEKLISEVFAAVNDDRENLVVDRFQVFRVTGDRPLHAVGSDREGPSSSPKKHVSDTVYTDPFSAHWPLGWEKEDLGQDAPAAAMEDLSLSAELEDFVEEVRFWLNSQEWYEERGVPWRRGYLFKGAPGTGKTSMARALAEELNMPLYIFDLASMDNHDFIGGWQKVMPRSIVLFEDIDGVFKGRENVRETGLSFDCLLNCVDGADKKPGVLLLVTTNHPETLDPAMWSPEAEAASDEMPSRPGRIDRAIEFLPLDEAGRTKLALRILKDEKLAKEVVRRGVNDSAAQLQERAFRVAVAQLFPKKKAA